jgi:hypothetical protein
VECDDARCVCLHRGSLSVRRTLVLPVVTLTETMTLLAHAINVLGALSGEDLAILDRRIHPHVSVFILCYLRPVCLSLSGCTLCEPFCSVLVVRNIASDRSGLLPALWRRSP